MTTDLQSLSSLFTSSDPEKLHRALQIVREKVSRVGSDQARPLFEMVSSLFYIDPHDDPELASLLDEAISLTTGFGAWVIPHLVDNLDQGDLKAQMASAEALGRIGADAVDPLVEAGARSKDLELRDTATRTIGRFAAVIPAGQISEDILNGYYDSLRTNLADPNKGVKAKAVRSLGKLARFGHLDSDRKQELKAIALNLLGEDDEFRWDRTFVVRREAQEALEYFQE
jgi:hypothetical protein